MTIDEARIRLALARTEVIRAENALTAAIKRRDAAEEALYRVEDEDMAGRL